MAAISSGVPTDCGNRRVRSFGLLSVHTQNFEPGGALERVLGRLLQRIAEQRGEEFVDGVSDALREYLKLNLKLPTVGRIGPLARTFDFVADAVADARAVEPERAAKSIGHEETFERDIARRLLMRFGYADGYHDAVSLRDVLAAHLVPGGPAPDAGRLDYLLAWAEANGRAELIITFLAILEMTRLRLTRLTQDGPLAPIPCASRTQHIPCPETRCPDEDACVLRALWLEARDAVVDRRDGDRGHDDVNLEANQLGGQSRKPLDLPLG